MAAQQSVTPSGAWWPAHLTAVAETIVAEVAGAPLGDARLSRRVEQVAAALAAAPGASLPQALGEWAALKAAYRLFDHAQVTPARLLAPHQQATAARLVGQARILAVQDTTYLDFTRHPASEVGPIGHTDQALQGLVLHSTLALTEDGTPLGLLTHQIWQRAQAPAAPAHRRPLEAKESYKWIAALRRAAALLPPQVEMVTVADPEADLFALFQVAAECDSHLLVRAHHARRLLEPAGASLWPTVRQSPVRSVLTIELPPRHQRPARTVTAALRWRAVTLAAPTPRVPAATVAPLQPQALWALTVDEIDPPAGAAEPLRWQLLTTLPVESLEQAVECVLYYRLRFEIEALHKVLKSGCRVEQARLRTTARLANYLTLMLIVAWRLFALRHLQYHQPQAPCSYWLAPHEWRALYVAVHEQPTWPRDPPTISEAVMWLGRLGGFLARRRDGRPGITTLWRGWHRLNDISDAFLTFHQPSTYV